MRSFYKSIQIFHVIDLQRACQSPFAFWKSDVKVYITIARVEFSFHTTVSGREYGQGRGLICANYTANLAQPITRNFTVIGESYFYLKVAALNAQLSAAVSWGRS